ncbi:hypothetical protein HD_1825 [[Haemophilus] ducreyi 35000HP]|uniref:Uncharacterized protein n=1 Tax=Haemophilus ducreyi (strain 35000HP / ATCC 700724) TaxID=233412 RepID=Q7VKP8_HAEDU|nr:hypothetical protein HD_1825 [[Haemophilus] ducreyi 35000HP]
MYGGNSHFIIRIIYIRMAGPKAKTLASNSLYYA